MSHTLRRLVATGALAGALSTAGLAGALAPAQAESAPTCDLTALTASLLHATADARAAQAAYTTYTRTSVHRLTVQLKATEVHEAKAAAAKAKAADRRAAKAAGTPQAKDAREAARAARVQARAESREAAKVVRASAAQLRTLVKVERDRLRSAWDAAKATLHSVRAQAEACAESTTPEPTTPETE